MRNKKEFKIIIFIFLISIPAMLFSGSGILLAAEDTGFISKEVPVDMVLVIDESGSMKVNDPDDLRVDAARLFIELNQILTERNRVSVAGFGETTNIYIEPTDVAMNKQEIMEAVSSIKSNQNYTDMKAVLEEVKLMLDERIKKNHAVVIFLTDGDLGVDDIPIPDEIREGSVDGGGKPEPPSRGTGEQEEESKVNEEDKDSGPEGTNREDSLDQYLEDYKEELFKLCYEYEEDGIRIFPVAFTAEANTDILQEIADITGSGLWVSRTAADVRNVYLDIFKYLTNTFISVIPQEGTESLTGDIELPGYIRKAAFIAVSNENTDNPSIELTLSPPGAEQETVDINDSSYSIKVIEAPEEGKRKYNVSGDLILALDAAEISLVDPLKAVYFMDSGIPVVVKLSHSDMNDTAANYSDFKISCDIEYPDGGNSGKVNLLDDGNGIDENKDDGIYSYLFEGVESAGEYIIEFTIEHLPTGSSSLKKRIFTVTDYQPVKKELYLKIENNIITGTPVIIHANFEDFSEGSLSYTVTTPSGKVTGGKLFDNGSTGNSDDAGSDGIYSNDIGGLDELGEYIIQVEGEYESSEGYDLVQTVKAEIGKYVDIKLLSENPEMNPDTGTVRIQLRATSIHDSNLSVAVMDQLIEDDVVSNIEMDQDLLQAGSEQDINVIIHLSDEIGEGGHNIIIPLVLNGIYTKNIEIDFSFQKNLFKFDLKMLVGLILIFLSLIPLIFLLYTIVNMKRLKIRPTHPRVIVEFSIFVVFFVAGLIVIFI